MKKFDVSDFIRFYFITILYHLEVLADFEYVVSKPESLVVPINFDTELLCEMNIPPDKFQWKFYPTDEPYDERAYNDLNSNSFRLLSHDRYKVYKKRSDLSIRVKNTDAAGDYQCLAYYGASVVASVPWRITLPKLKTKPSHNQTSVSVQVGNTVSWRCDAPQSNPDGFVYYDKDYSFMYPPFPKYDALKVQSLILPNVTVSDSGKYGCKTSYSVHNERLGLNLQLTVLRDAPPMAPSFISDPKKEYTVVKGSSIFLECAAIGNPVPKVTWSKRRAQLLSDRMEVVAGGLIIHNMTSADEGTYTCSHKNSYGLLNWEINIKYHEAPSIGCLTDVYEVKQGQVVNISCDVKGIPIPEISWFLNGFSVNNDSLIKPVGAKLIFDPIAKKHAGNIQLFARNVVDTISKSIAVKVYPLASNIAETESAAPRNHSRHGKHRKTEKKAPKPKIPKMIPPSRPNITRSNEESVVVRWTVPNNNGLPIQFFKVQYKEIGTADSKTHYLSKDAEWNTANTDIPPNIKSYEVSELKPGYYYKFRVAAVYSNNDSKMSERSKKFYLERLNFDQKNPLPVCLITFVETVNHTAVKIYWECPKYDVTVDGFYISYMSATRAGDDYMKNTVEGENIRNYIINYLQPETSYDIKLQSYNSKLASDFSPVMKGRTLANTFTTVPTTTKNTNGNSRKISTETNSPDNTFYFIVAGCVLGFGVVVTSIILLVVCRKWKHNRDKPLTDHHVQQNSEPRPITRTNGCILPGNKITITPNPMADGISENNKNPNMTMEMHNLCSSNNNIRRHSSSNSPTKMTLGNNEQGVQNSKNSPTTGRIKKKMKKRNDLNNCQQQQQ